jgi:hypothetical protein
MVTRIRRVSVDLENQELPAPPPAGTYRGFGTVRGETLDQFHDRMFDIDPLEAAMYEMEVALEQQPQSSN